MKTKLNIIVPLWGESTGDRWILLNDAENNHVMDDATGTKHNLALISIFHRIHWNGNVVILTKFSLLPAPKSIKMTTFNAASGENFVKMTTFSVSV